MAELKPLPLYQSSPMTTQRDFDQMPTYTLTDLTPISSDPDEDWLHPVLEIFRPEKIAEEVKQPRLYLVPSHFGEEFDAEFGPQPTSATELPDINEIMLPFVHKVVEIWAGKRSSNQIQALCHHTVSSELKRGYGSLKEIGRVRKIRTTQPLDGVCEATVTVRFGERLRVITIRFEGIDKRWLCTHLALI